MQALFTVLLSVFLLSIHPLSLSAATAPPKAQVTAAAESWLQLIDAGDFAKSWQTASVFFRNAVSQANWSNALQASRSPLGALEQRTLTSVQEATALPGAPDGHYCILSFTTAFALKKQATETLTFTEEADGQWRSAGYFIK
nr:DUF4019 domain-containing protein [uncultured Desulfobulbus sp.]